ncbi:DUF1150 family protein [Yoonia litorea]|uniref:DUF1150 domain-containing protein n=1 Tax=Yoonia litorea TaxID=1123755 RepID=A0A1I6N1T4_9RHOB|nr:DUF1150 family protein [Yoonia litorea]SFS21906.1 hypothetical protein SAMN05444714_3008 [Yoonia litorea]
MDTKFDLEKISQNIVYVKPVVTADLPTEVQDQVGDLDQIYAVHNASGEQLALVADRKLAFHLAREHKMEPVTLH